MSAYGCNKCGFTGHTYNELVEHDERAHGVKPVDPGNEFSSPSAKKLAGLIEWLRKAPDANLRTGEGKVLLDEIDRLTKELETCRCPHNQLKLYMDYCVPFKVVCAICDMPVGKDAIYIV